MNIIRLHRPTVRRRIVDTLTREITSSMAPGQRLHSESRLAKRFGVALATMREALCALAERGLIERRHGSGTYVTDRVRNLSIGLLVSIDPRYQLTYGAVHRVQRLGAILTGRGFPTRTYLFVKPEGDQDREDPTYASFLDDISEHRLCGVIAVQGPGNREWVERTRAVGLPTVNGDSYRVAGDGLDVIQQGARYLVGKGRRRMALMGWFPSIESPHGDRETFKELLRKAGATVRDEWIRGEAHPTLPGAGYEEFREIWMADPVKPDGLLVVDDILFPDVTVAIRECGIRVPDQLLVVATANKGNVTAPFFPAARLEFDLDHEAEVMSDLMIKLIRGHPISRREILLPYRLIENGHPHDESPQLSAVQKEVS